MFLPQKESWKKLPLSEIQEWEMELLPEATDTVLLVCSGITAE